MSSTYDRVLAEFRANKTARESGRQILIPWESFPKLSTVLPGVQKGRYVIVTANSKVGKSQLCDYLFLYEPLNYMYKHPETNIKLKIFYFSLEMSKEDKIAQMASHKLFKDNGITISPDKLKSYFNDYVLEDPILSLLEDYNEYFNFVDNHVEIIDNIRNPFGIYRHVREFARQNGKFYKKDGTEVVFDTPESFSREGHMYDYYVPNDPDLHIIVITDHTSLLSIEKGQGSLWETMFRYSSEYCLKMRDNFKYTVVNVQQQAADQEKQQYNFKGSSVIDKIRPSADGLGDAKVTGRDCDLMLGLFAPVRYKTATEYAGYDIKALKDNYRELSILLNRRGPAGVNLDMYFDGAVNFFAELTPSNKINYQDRKSWY